MSIQVMSAKIRAKRASRYGYQQANSLLGSMAGQGASALNSLQNYDQAQWTSMLHTKDLGCRPIGTPSFIPCGNPSPEPAPWYRFW